MRVAVLVNGSPEGAQAIRARSLFEHLRPDYDPTFYYRSRAKLRSIAHFLAGMRSQPPGLLLVVDVAYSGILAAAIHRLLNRVPVVVDTGDSIGALARSLGRGPLGVFLTDALDRLALAISDVVVVRGTLHGRWLTENGVKRVVVIQDGVDLSQFVPTVSPALRKTLGVDNSLVVGMIGSISWNTRYQIAYGWDLIEALPNLRGRRIKALIVGDGDGLAHLKDLAFARGVTDMVVFAGRVPYDSLPDYLGAMDICVSTQSNDTVGAFRTTGKLPLYMAAGKYVIATDVGEASLVLPNEMRFQYDGVKDETWPKRLALELIRLDGNRDALTLGVANHERAAMFDYGLLSARLAHALSLARAVHP